MLSFRQVLSCSPLICGRCAAAVLATGSLLLATYLLSMGTGLLECATVQVPTLQPLGEVRWSFHCLGHTVEDTAPLFPVLCFLLVLPSLAGGGAVLRFFRRRWRGIA
jgi:hypothetical protein